jgi:hypothetical protein
MPISSQRGGLRLIKEKKCGASPPGGLPAPSSTPLAPRRTPCRQELAHRYRHSPASTPKQRLSDSNNQPAPPPAVAAAAAAALAGGCLARQGSIGRSIDIGALTASTILAMYRHDDNECVLLSELQVRR